MFHSKGLGYLALGKCLKISRAARKILHLFELSYCYLDVKELMPIRNRIAGWGIEVKGIRESRDEARKVGEG